MTNSLEESNDRDEALRRLLELARSATAGGLTPAEESGLGRFEQTLARQELRWGRRFWALGLGAGAAAAVVAGVVLWLGVLGDGATALTYDVVGGASGDGGYVRAGGARSTELRFSDGTNMVLAPGTRTRVADVGRHGARVLLETGVARVHVQPRPRAKWSLEAGPYTVRVTGTVFDLGWSGSEEVLDLRLEKGSVVVKGPLAGQGLTLEAGQHLLARVREGEIFLDGRPPVEGGVQVAAGTVPGEEPRADFDSAASRASRRSAARPAARTGGAASVRDLPWSRRLAQGDFQGILAEAERAGLDGTLATAPVADLAALADAARYARRADLARRALLAQRERFPQTRQAEDAAFFLGGIAENEPGAEQSSAALTWYARYLETNPQGAYAAQALGRKMVLVHKLRGAGAARSIAALYVAQFPEGPYAAQARRLVGRQPPGEGRPAPRD